MTGMTLDAAMALAEIVTPAPAVAHEALKVLRAEVERLQRYEVCVPGDQLRDVLQVMAGDDLTGDVMLAFYGRALGHSGEGFYAYSAEHPEEGAIKLDAALEAMREPRSR